MSIMSKMRNRYMAIAEYHIAGKMVASRNFMVPKRASELKYWYYAVKVAIPRLPKFEPRFLVNADVSVETIILDWETNGFCHRLLIARKRTMW